MLLYLTLGGCQGTLVTWFHLAHLFFACHLCDYEFKVQATHPFGPVAPCEVYIAIGDQHTMGRKDKKKPYQNPKGRDKRPGNNKKEATKQERQGDKESKEI